IRIILGVAATDHAAIVIVEIPDITVVLVAIVVAMSMPLAPFVPAIIPLIIVIVVVVMLAAAVDGRLIGVGGRLHLVFDRRRLRTGNIHRPRSDEWRRLQIQLWLPFYRSP